MANPTLQKMNDTYKKEFMLSEDEVHVSYLHPYPVTPATTIIESKNEKVKCIFKLPIDEYKQLLFRAKRTAELLCKNIPVNRCALVTKPVECGPSQIKIIPLHGVNSEWEQAISPEPEYNEEYPGYCNSKNGPRVSEESLTNIQDKVRSKLETTSISYEFFGDADDKNLFSRIVRGEEKQWRVWEDSEHVAFLTPFPNSPGFTVVIPRMHLSSDIFSLEEKDYEKLIEAAYKVSTLLKSSLSIDFTCMIFEGFEIDYAHAKLIPVITKNDYSEKSNINLPTEFHPKYIGYVTSLDGPLVPKEEMQKVFQQLKRK
ncbi:unnamed protein product [Rotaria sp. Silwood2]|nr:unnamed protein product [Rotaria sp. Silwood2]CAF4181427.1 unnamed protein product [Rotaria sp. Silwood2]